MKPLPLLLPLLAAAIISVAPATAQTPRLRTLMTHPVATEITHSRSLGASRSHNGLVGRELLGLKRHATAIHLNSRSSAPAAAIDPGALDVPASAFSPATFDGPQGIDDNGTADTLWFAADHSKSYESLQRVSGYFESADWSSTQYYDYQGSTFASATTAAAAQKDGVTYVSSQTGDTPTDCTSAFNLPCDILAYQTSDNQGVLYNDIQVGPCLVETAAHADASLFNQSSVSTALANTLAQITNAAVSIASTACLGTSSTTGNTGSTTTPTPTPSPTPTPTTTTISYSILKVQWAKGGTDVSKSTAHISKAKEGSKVQLVVYFNVDSAPASEPVSIDFSVSKSGKQVAHGSTSGNLDATDPTGTYPVSVNWKLPKKTGTYVGKATVSMGGQSESGTAKIKDQKK